MIVSQAVFTAGLLDPELTAPDGLQDGRGAPTSKRFDVYRNNVAVSLTDALEGAFPVVHKLVGAEFFRAMAGIYQRKHLPESALMMFYGHKMPQFLKRFPPAQSLAYLPDVARLEIALRKSYHAADAEPVTPDTLGALSPDALMAARITLAPALRVVSSIHPIHAIWQVNMVAGSAAPVRVPETVLITRPRFDPQQHVITAQEAAFVTALQDNLPLGVAMSKAGAELDLGTLLGLLLRQGAITKIT